MPYIETILDAGHVHGRRTALPFRAPIIKRENILSAASSFWIESKYGVAGI
jgi:hypothetical protein